jgi:PII-like signaling protein
MDDPIKLLRIYTDETAYFGDHKLYVVISTRARDASIAGITVLRAMLGFGRSAHVHRQHVLENDQSILIEIVDNEAKLRRFVESLADLPDIGLVTLEAVEVLRTPQAT